MSAAPGRAALLALLRRPLAELPDVVEIPAPRPVGKEYPIEASVRPPGSKSLTNRALLLAGLADGQSTIRGALRDADDARVMLQALRLLGAEIEDRGTDLLVTGVCGRWKPANAAPVINVTNAGTAARFLAAAALLSPVPLTIDGNARMRERPIRELGDVLTSLGCTVEYLASAGCPPLRITPPAAGKTLPAVLEIGTTQSSQFISGLLLAAPFLPAGLTLRLTGEVTSASYVTMTLALLGRLNATTRTSDDLRVLRVCGGATGRPSGLPPFEYDVEPDASSATYWWGAASIMPGAKIRVLGPGPMSIQGDVVFPELLERMGATVIRREWPEPFIEVTGGKRLRPILADMREIPDAAMTLAAVACFAEGTSILRGLRTLRVKETDRLAALRTELSKLGVKVENPVQGDPDAMTITPPAGGLDGSIPVTFDTYNDHRMAMALSLIGLRRPNVFIRDPACVAKTYPAYWSDLARVLGARDSE